MTREEMEDPTIPTTALIADERGCLENKSPTQQVDADEIKKPSADEKIMSLYG